MEKSLTIPAAGYKVRLIQGFRGVDFPPAETDVSAPLSIG